MGTIVQEYGPIYGEAVNGTIQGRPNGSIYVPQSNKIEISNTPNTSTLFFSSGRVVLSNGVHHVAESQDPASYVGYQLFSDSGCTTQIGTTVTFPAGEFNGTHVGVAWIAADPLTSGTTYYIRAQLFNGGQPVATSNVLERDAV